MRHRWGDRFVVDDHLTRRICTKCGMRKFSHHQSEGPRDVHWQTFESAEGVAFQGEGTPACFDQAAQPAPSEDALIALG